LSRDGANVLAGVAQCDVSVLKNVEDARRKGTRFYCDKVVSAHTFGRRTTGAAHARCVALERLRARTAASNARG